MQVLLTLGVANLSFNHTAAALFVWLNMMLDNYDKDFIFKKNFYTLMLTITSE